MGVGQDDLVTVTHTAQFGQQLRTQKWRDSYEHDVL
jgi:hypothetical protein